MMETKSQVRARKAIRSFARSQRLSLRVEEAPSPFEKVVAQQEAAAASAESNAMLTPLTPVVSAAGEMTTEPQASEALDPTRTAILEARRNPHTVEIGAAEERLEANDAAGVLISALDAAVAVDAKTSIEKMLAYEFAAAHHLAMKLIARAGESQEAADAARYVNAAARLLVAGQNGLLTLQRWRSGGKQTVIVQRVNVSEGGQAVVAGGIQTRVGAVKPRGKERTCQQPDTRDGSGTTTRPGTSRRRRAAAQ
jgi:hypothetical protein